MLSCEVLFIKSGMNAGCRHARTTTQNSATMSTVSDVVLAYAEATWKPGLVSTIGTSGEEASVVMKAFSSSPSTSSLCTVEPSDSPTPRSLPLSSMRSIMCFRTFPIRSSTGTPLMMLRVLPRHAQASTCEHATHAYFNQQQQVSMSMHLALPQAKYS